MTTEQENATPGPYGHTPCSININNTWVKLEIGPHDEPLGIPVSNNIFSFSYPGYVRKIPGYPGHSQQNLIFRAALSRQLLQCQHYQTGRPGALLAAGIRVQGPATVTCTVTRFW
eukprot:814724-Rhodomonas_salina.1